MNWTEKHIKGLLFEKKIRSYQVPERTKDPEKRIPQPKSKAIAWLDMNLAYFCNEKALTLEKEYRFCPDRGWRFDYAIAPGSLKIAIEYHGGIFMARSGHTNKDGFLRDSDKINRATVLGWKVITINALNYTTVLKTLNEMIKS